MSIKLNQFPTNNSLVEELTPIIVECLIEAIEIRGEARIAFSGGSTPVLLFEALSQCDIAWERVIVTLVDERWVESSHNDSNEKLVRTHLLKSYAGKAKFVGLKISEANPVMVVASLSAVLRAEVLPLDAVVLGMGDDGHTASFFSGATSLSEALDLNLASACIAVEPPAAPYLRMTLSLASVLSARRLFLHFVGEKKLRVFEKARTSLDASQLPICAVLDQEQVDVEIFYAIQ
jgi:6-phosphogluconolactonase